MDKDGRKWEFHQKCMLIGQFTHDIDPKKRLTLPVKWRKSLGDSVVITSGLDNSLFLFNISQWENIAEKLSALSIGDVSVRNFTRFFLANAFELVVDSQGRIIIPEILKSFANLESDVILVGMHTRIELWNQNSWKETMFHSVKNANNIAEELSKIGVF